MIPFLFSIPLFIVISIGIKKLLLAFTLNQPVTWHWHFGRRGLPGRISEAWTVPRATERRTTRAAATASRTRASSTTPSWRRPSRSRSPTATNRSSSWTGTCSGSGDTGLSMLLLTSSLIYFMDICLAILGSSGEVFCADLGVPCCPRSV